MKSVFLAAVLALTASAWADVPGRDWLLGFERSKMTTPEELLDGINYLRMQLRSQHCTAKAGFTTLTVKNHLWDYPNSKKYLGFAWVRIPAPVPESCQIEIDKMSGWFKMIGMETVSVTAPNVPPTTREVRIPINSLTFHCRLDQPHFPSGYALSVNGKSLWSEYTDKCETHRRLLAQAQAEGGTLAVTETTSSYETIDFTNTGNTGDYRLRWKLITVTPIRIKVGDVIFDGAGYAPKDISHE